MNTTTEKTAGAKCAEDITALLRARNPLIWCVTREEARAESIIATAAAAANYPPIFWDCAAGFQDIGGSIVDGSVSDVGLALAAVRDAKQRGVYVLRDLHAWLRDPNIMRQLRSLCRALPGAPRDQARAVIVISPSGEIPPELQGHAIVVDVPLPDRAEVGRLIDAAVEALPEDMQAGALPNREAAMDAAIGLTSEEVQSVCARSLIVAGRRIDSGTIAGEKRRVIARERVLEWFDPLPAGLDGVGGLANLKAWLLQRRAAFTPEARAYGLKAPKGVVMVGVPGCGKSLSAKAIATAWGMPLLRLDMGALQSKWVGESQQNIRKALKVAETVAPAILWLDEIEKAFAGATQGAADGGVSSDALGAVLQWMQDRAGSVFVVATANDVSKLPPELMRKGRFDEVFFVDLPTAPERSDVLRTALREARRDAVQIDLDEVAAAAVDFSGAEMAALVPDAMFAAFNDGGREITTDDLVAAARATVPIARTATEKVKALREWAAGRARPASAPAETKPRSDRRQIDVV